MTTIAILGTKTTCLRLIEALTAHATTPVSVIVTLNDETDTRSEMAGIVAAGERLGIRTVVAESPADAYRVLLEAAPAVVFVAGWYRIIPPTVLDAVPHGFVGVHYSKLPAYRGSAPVVWAIINGETEVGFSIFRMTPGMDEGPVAAQGAIPVSESDYVADVLEALDAASLNALVAVADGIATGTAVWWEQPLDGLSFGGARNPGDGWLDWSLPAVEVARHVRAQSKPYPGAHTVLGDTMVKVWRARHDAGVSYHGAPGQVVRMWDGSPVVACGGGTGLVLEEWESPSPLKFSLLTSRFGQHT